MLIVKTICCRCHLLYHIWSLNSTHSCGQTVPWRSRCDNVYQWVYWGPKRWTHFIFCFLEQKSLIYIFKLINLLILWILVFPTKSYYFSLLHFTYTGIYTQCWWNVSKMYIDLYMYLYIKPMYIVINVWTSNSLGISMAYYIIMCKIPKFDCACTCSWITITCQGWWDLYLL